MSIQIFASDHRKNINWNLPYIRVGCPSSDSFLVTADEEIDPFNTLLSEGAQMWWVFKHLAEFGNPDYVGFCHYRRFFTKIRQCPILNIDESQFKAEYCMTPVEVYSVLQANAADGAVFSPITAVNCETTGCRTIVDQLKFLSKNDGLGFPDDVSERSFELFLKHTPGYMLRHLEKAMNERAMYACNIFVLRRDLFSAFCEIFIPAVKELYASLDKTRLPFMHPRFIGYILERFTSCYLYALQYAGRKLVTLPLMTINGERHVRWEAPAK